MGWRKLTIQTASGALQRFSDRRGTQNSDLGNHLMRQHLSEACLNALRLLGPGGHVETADLLLHSDPKNVIVRQQAPVMKLVTVSPVAAGAALTDCYGCSAGVSNHALRSSWGFVPAELERELNGAFVRVGYGQCSHNYYLQMHAKKPGKKEPAHRLFSFLRQLTRLNTHDGQAEAQARVRHRPSNSLLMALCHSRPRLRQPRQSSMFF